MTLAEQIAAFVAKRAAAAAVLQSVITKSEGRTLDEAEREEYDNAEAELKSIDEHVARLKRAESLMVASAAPVQPVQTAEGAAELRGAPAQHRENERTPQIIQVERKLPPGIAFARFAICMAVARGNPYTAMEVARDRYPEFKQLPLAIKATVAAGTTAETTWASPLVEYQNFAGDFVEYLRPQTILGKFGTNGIPSLRRVPFNIRIAGQTSGGAGYWVGEGLPKPLTKFDFNSSTLDFTKVANIAVITEELLRFSNPAAEGLVRDGLRDALVERLDIDFVDPAKAAVANVSPASVTNGVSAITASGTDADAIRADVRSVMAAYIAARMSPSTGVWIVGATTALGLSLIMGPLGEPEFPGITMQGGTFAGLPVIVSEHLDELGDTSGGLIVLVNASDVWLADDGGFNIDASREASLQMLDNPTNASSTGTATSMVSMFQTNSIAIRAERFINWKKRRAQAVQYITGVNYGAAA